MFKSSEFMTVSGINFEKFVMAASEIRLFPTIEIELNLKLSAVTKEGLKKNNWQKKAIKKIRTGWKELGNSCFKRVEVSTRYGNS